MIAPADLTTLFNQPEFDASTVSSLSHSAFTSVDTLQRFRELTEALERQTLSSGGEGREAALKLGTAFWLLGQPQRALEWLGKARGSKERHYYAGLCYREVGQYDRAENEFEKAAAAGWDELECICERAETQVLAGNSAAARTLLDGAAARGQFAAAWHYARGRYLAQEGDSAEAIAALEHAVQLNGAHSRALFHLAFQYDLHGADDQAVDFYERCSQQPPVHVNALINLSVLLEDQGRDDEAEQCLRRVLAAYPNHLRAQLFLKDVLASAQQMIDENWERQNEQWNAILDTPITDYELSVRSRNCLKKLNLNTLGDLTRISQAELLAYKNFGETSLNEIKAMLSQKGLRLGQAVENAAAAAGAGSSAAAGAASRAAPRKAVLQGNPELLSRPVGELELSVRSRKCLQRLNIATVADLAARSEPELLAVRNFGQTSLNEIKRRLTELGLSLRQSG